MLVSADSIANLYKDLDSTDMPFVGNGMFDCLFLKFTRSAALLLILSSPKTLKGLITA